MKLDLTRWREAVRALEANLKALKAERRRHRPPGEPFDDQPRFLCQAEVTRLYCLRRWAKGRLHTKGRLRFVRVSHCGGRRYTTLHQVAALEAQEALLRSEPGWLESFLVGDVEPRAPDATPRAT